MTDVLISSRSSPAEIADEIAAMIPNYPRELPVEAPSGDRWQRRREIEEHGDRLAELKNHMVSIFGAQQGWRRTRRWFNVTRLAGRGRGYAMFDDWPHLYADHAYFYLRNRQPIAVVAHPYDICAEDPRGVFEWAAREGAFDQRRARRKR